MTASGWPCWPSQSWPGRLPWLGLSETSSSEGGVNVTTPGPWAVLPIKNKTLIVSPHVGQVAALNGASPDDAALMASAPALLAALQKLVRAIDRLPGNNPLDGLADEARDAISQAQQGQ